jgi:hypothetical protein
LLETLFVLSFNHQNPQSGLIALTKTKLRIRSASSSPSVVQPHIVVGDVSSSFPLVVLAPLPA